MLEKKNCLPNFDFGKEVTQLSENK